MARPEHLYVFAYDISRDRLRTKVSELLERHLVRAQLSLFEGRMTAPRAKALAHRVETMIGPDDSLRVYCVTEAGRRASMAFGPNPLPEAQQFFLV